MAVPTTISISSPGRINENISRSIMWSVLLIIGLHSLHLNIVCAQTNNQPLELSSHYFGYLQKYGYAEPGSPDSGTLRTIAEYSDGILSFQKMYGLEETGYLTSETQTLMDTPRCGVPDREPRGGPGQIRAKRYAHSGMKWSKRDLTYSFTSYTSDMSRNDQRNAIQKAFQVWSDVTPLTFTEVAGNADILIQFSIYDHRDGYPFDGQGGTLAHAFFPDPYLGGLDGDSHFDDSEHFTVNTDQGTDLFIVAAHEFGHSLGLGHSADLLALMAPFYSGYKASFRLPYDDQLAMQLLYGSRPVQDDPEEQPPVIATLPPPKPDDDRCTKVYDSVASIRGEIFLFKGAHFWRMRVLGQPNDGYPQKTSTFFKDLPKNIDASYERFDGTIMFFKGSEYWEYDNLDAREGFPKLISDLGLPNDIGAALPWGYTGKTYFFKGKKYWRYDEYNKQVDEGYPKFIRDSWRGIPGNLFAAFRHYDGYSYSTYFLKYRRYWRFDEARSSVDVGYPRIFDVDWMGCSVASLEDLDGSIVEEEEEKEDEVEYIPNQIDGNDSGVPADKPSIIVASLLLVLSVVLFS